jgi:hypothetical protein
MPYRAIGSQFRTTVPESTDCETKRISVGQRKMERAKFAGFTGKYIRTRLSKKEFHTLDAVRQEAVRLYWEAVLGADEMSMRSGEKVGSAIIVYVPEIRVLDFFAEDKTYDIPEDNGERLETE